MKPPDSSAKFGFYDFFAGGGMAHIGLGHRWRCLMANDFSSKKARAYRANFPPANELIEADVRELTSADLLGRAELSWASFPCQDLSLAGKMRGLQGERSGSFWGFWRLMQALEHEGRPSQLIVLENVTGTITANKGADFQTLLDVLVQAGYYVGPMVVNARHFLPQSRPRLFIIAVKKYNTSFQGLIQNKPAALWHPDSLRRVYLKLPEDIRKAWIWWHLPKPPPYTLTLKDLIEENPDSVQWHTPQETQRLLDLMMPLHLSKVKKMQNYGKKMVGTIYRRVRKDKNGVKGQRAEIRIDGVSGCLRTGSGGSSRQFIMLVKGENIRTRLLSAREAARLMGVPDSYKLPSKFTEAYHLMGDGLVVPVVAWIEKQLLAPLMGIEVTAPIEVRNETTQKSVNRLLSQRPHRQTELYECNI